MNGSSRYKLAIAYDGTRFSGWQSQPNATSIQTLVENALTTILRTPISIVGSGRTDAGVHALEQIAHFTCDKPVDLSTLRRSLNGILPEEIRILNVQPVDPHFHARYSAKGKIYHYHIDLGSFQNPFSRLYSLHIGYPIDIGLLKEAAKCFVGTHDFSSFSNEADRGSAGKNPIRTLKRLDVIMVDEDTMRLEFEGDGFLYKMVRNITGTLIDIARGKIEISDLPGIFEAKNRAKAGACASAKGLLLVKVFYE